MRPTYCAASTSFPARAVPNARRGAPGPFPNHVENLDQATWADFKRRPGTIGFDYLKGQGRPPAPRLVAPEKADRARALGASWR
ncbi:MAG: hypothetical protein WKG07_12255 [Hymenobacter sp.]